MESIVLLIEGIPTIVWVIITCLFIGFCLEFIHQKFYVYPCGKTISEAKKYLEENTHCGKCWNYKARYSRLKNIVFIYMEGNEYVEFNLTTGKVKIEDHDY